MSLETFDGEESEQLINNDVHNAYSWVERTAEQFLADGRWRSKKDEELHREIEKMSAEKAKDLFSSEKARKAWVEAIKKSVEQSIQSQVRAALGTPPGEKRKKLHEQRIAEETKRRQAKNQAFDMDREFEKGNYNYPSVHEQEDTLFQRRQQYLQKYAVRRTMRHIHDPTLRSTKGLCVDNCDNDSGMDPLSSEFNKRFNIYTRAALENVGKSNLNTITNDVYKRSQGCIWIDRNGERHEVPGPYWPKDHLPRLSSQKHIQFIPDFVEPLNTEAENSNTANKSGRGNLMYPRQWKGNCIVYERQNKGQGNSHLVPPGSPPSLVFESRFECGNLKQARRVGSYEYDLVLDCDLYTKRHTQWYYFRVQNMVSDALYTFNILNLLKRESLYNYGMKPLLYSERDVTLRGQGWKRVGSNISYYKTTSIKNPLPCRQSIYYTLSFQMEFSHAGDTCYLAHCYPYSYTDLELYLRTIVDNPRTSQHVQQEVLCKTVAGNNCYVLTITSAKVPESEKLGVVVSARVHPGETNASWMMKGMLDFLASGHHIAEKLRRKFVFKLVPMLNPDGVIVGNYRTNLAARDLNRTYKDPRKETFPTVWHMKNMLESFKKDHQVIIYCDLHGHSRKPNVFMYGCTADPKMASMRNFIEERLFPWMMSQKAPDKFSFSGCKFRVRKCKESTARVVMWRQMGITNSFTMEATFCGANFGDIEKGRHFNVGDFEEMGRHFCEVLLEYSEAKCGNRTEMTQAFVELTCKMTREILRQTLGNYHPGGKSAATDNEMTGSQASSSKSNQTGTGKDGTSQPGDRASLWKPRNVLNNEKTTPAVAELNHGIKLSVQSVHVESFNDCLKILENLDLADCFDESDSSDSDSDRDIEVQDKDAQTSRTNSGEKKIKTKKKKKVKHWWDTLSKVQLTETSNSTTTEDDEAIKEKKTKISFGKFINPYISRSNGGIPIFAQERILERARKKEGIKQKTSQDPERKDFLVKYEEETQNPPSVLAVTDDPELSFVTAERRLAYYMVDSNHQQGLGLKAAHGRNKVPPGLAKRIMQVDSFKFDYLTGGGYGFAISIPGRSPSVVQRTQSGLYTNGGDQSSRESLQSFEEARGKPRMKQLSPVYSTYPIKERARVREEFSEVSSSSHADHGRYHDNSLEKTPGVASRHAARNARFRTGMTGSFDLEMPEQRKRFTGSRGARVTPFVGENSGEVKSLSAGHRTKSERQLFEPSATISSYSHVMYPLSGRKQR